MARSLSNLSDNLIPQIVISRIVQFPDFVESTRYKPIKYALLKLETGRANNDSAKGRSAAVLDRAGAVVNEFDLITIWVL